MNKLPRRSFLQRTGSVILAANLAPYATWGKPDGGSKNDKLNIAAIGIGGMGSGDIGALAPGNNIVALCDADWERGAGTFKRFPAARQFKDFRRMFDTMEKEIDAVIVATPDHFHAVAAMAAIQRGKHVYCEKPLAHNVAEIRGLMRAARERKVVTQLGNQGHSFDSSRTFCEMIWDGAIGKVHTIHAGSAAMNTALKELPSLKERFEIPPKLAWDIWQGPAQERGYNPAYLPAKWRQWTAYGSGTVGDWMCHVVDPVFWALKLGAPTAIQAKVEDYDPVTQGESYPAGDMITYEFPGSLERGPVTLHWYSGKTRIPRPAEMEPDEKDIEIGAVVIGDKGTIVYGSHGATQVRLIPEKRNLEYKRPEKKIARVKGHHADFVEAIRAGRPAGSDFSYGGPLTELASLGIIAIRFPGQKLEWDAEKMKFTNFSAANQHLQTTYRQGWTL